MPAAIELTADALVVHIEGADKRWAVKAIRHAMRPPGGYTGYSAGGRTCRGCWSAGRFHSHGELVFQDVHEASKAIAVELGDQRYARLVIEVDDPGREIARIAETAGAVSR